MRDFIKKLSRSRFKLLVVVPVLIIQAIVAVTYIVALTVAYVAGWMLADDKSVYTVKFKLKVNGII
jgi:hypothetical protein